MSLLYDLMSDCVILDKTTQPDGYGGVTTTWVDGAKIKAALVPTSTSEALQAQRLELVRIYHITTERTVVLKQNDVVKRVSDGLVLRVTEDGTDQGTPDSAMLDMRTVTAEVWNFHG